MWNLILSFVNDVWASLCQFSRYYIKKKKQKKKMAQQIACRCFFSSKGYAAVQLYTGCFLYRSLQAS